MRQAVHGVSACQLCSFRWCCVRVSPARWAVSLSLLCRSSLRRPLLLTPVAISFSIPSASPHLSHLFSHFSTAPLHHSAVFPASQSPRFLNPPRCCCDFTTTIEANEGSAPTLFWCIPLHASALSALGFSLLLFFFSLLCLCLTPGPVRLVWVDVVSDPKLFLSLKHPYSHGHERPVYTLTSRLRATVFPLRGALASPRA